MEKVMSEFKAGELKSGGDKTVKKRKQAIAIGLAMDYKAHGKKNPKKTLATLLCLLSNHPRELNLKLYLL